MLAKAFAKCLASMDNGPAEVENLPVRQAPFIPDDDAPKIPLNELKVGVLVAKISWRGSYERLLQIDDNTLATLDPADSRRVTNRWALTDLANVRQDNELLTLELAPGCMSCGIGTQKLQISCHTVPRAEMLRHGLAIACRDVGLPGAPSDAKVES